MINAMKCLATIAFLASVAPSFGAVPPQMNAFVQKWCIDCHDADVHKGGLSFDSLDFVAEPDAHAKWARVFDKVLSDEMPPKNKPHADEDTARALLAMLSTGLSQQHAAMRGTVMRRLNRALRRLRRR